MATAFTGRALLGNRRGLAAGVICRQNETYLNIANEEALLDAYKRCLASNFTDRRSITNTTTALIASKSISPSSS